MKAKHVVILAAVLGALIAVILLQKTQEKPVTIIEQVKFARLVPEGMTQADIAKIELYRGSAADQKIVLTREESGDTWRVASHFNAPADMKAIEDFVDKLADAKGEPRATVKTDADFDAYDLSDAKSFHIVGYKKGSDEAAFHVLVGKSPSFSQTFVRMAEGKDVFVNDLDLRREAGGADALSAAPSATTSEEQPLQATKWVKKEVVNIAKDDIVAITIKTPDKQLALERHEKPAAAPPADSSAAAPPAAPEYEWRLTSGGLGTAIKQAGVDNVLRAFGPFMASDIADPAKKDEYGLQPPGFVCTVKSAKQETPIVIEGGRPDPKGNAYLRVASEKDDVVYSLPAVSFERLFPKGNVLFDLPGVGLTADAIDRMELVQPDGNITLIKKDGAWHVEEPAARLTAQTSTIESIARALAAWRAADYADIPLHEAGLESSDRRVTFTAGPSTLHTLTFGGAVPGIDALYVRFDQGDKVYVMMRSDYDAIFVQPKNLFELALLDVMEDDIKAVRFDGKEGKYALEREGAEWKLLADGARDDADDEVVANVLSSLSMLQADNIFFHKAALEGDSKQFQRVTVVTHDNTEHVLTFGLKDDSGYPLTVSGKSAVFHVASAEANTLLPSPGYLRHHPEEAPQAADESAGSESTESQNSAAPDALLQ